MPEIILWLISLGTIVGIYLFVINIVRYIKGNIKVHIYKSNLLFSIIIFIIGLLAVTWVYVANQYKRTVGYPVVEEFICPIFIRELDNGGIKPYICVPCEDKNNLEPFQSIERYRRTFTRDD